MYACCLYVNLSNHMQMSLIFKCCYFHFTEDFNTLFTQISIVCARLIKYKIKKQKCHFEATNPIFSFYWLILLQIEALGSTP